MRPSIGLRQNIRSPNLRLGFRRQAARFQSSEGIVQLSEPFPTNKQFPITVSYCVALASISFRTQSACMSR